MSTGPEHFQKAQIAQEAAAALQANQEGGPEFTATEALLDALTHAVLALVAVTAMVGLPDMPSLDADAWETVAKTPYMQDGAAS